MVVRKQRKRQAIILFIVFLSLFGLYLYKENTTIGVTFVEIESDRIPESFHHFRIVQLSDIHDSEFGENNAELVNKVKQLSPDVIFITGDFIDRNRYDLAHSLEIVKQLQDVAPFYFVTGNHEISTNDTEHIKSELTSFGVHVLTNESVIVDKGNGEKIAVGGIEDPLSSNLDEKEYVERAIDKAFNDVQGDIYRILLSHRPEQFNVYVDRQIDLVFSGHAHGGQIRIPGIGGLLAPGQGWFPTYTSDVHEKDGTAMVVSRGLGNSLVPIRVFNQPEVIVVTLKSSIE
ncbi:metallophosphoesterase [Sporosarcina sp. ACRSL]|uniref:metallophosphoesterase n=1 Tax=Sporosarcina sp. ACRSL TaxID=2918215 RepID=UPI001EF4CEA0|nr:metallophosphoesterase [Sporosarcina sp. ACRSL]MCG7346062.1 metallophosphoesterase [Sporosarcina sp. ACRSL]